MKHAEPTNDHLERIADAQWGGSGDGIHFSDIYQHNACNHTLSGTIVDGDETYGFTIESGDWNGTVVLGWGARGRHRGIQAPRATGALYVCAAQRKPT